MGIPLTSQYYVDANRTDTYVEDGNMLTPYKTLSAAYAAAKIGATRLDPKYINLLSSITEDLTMDTGHVGLQGFTNSGTYAPLFLNGTVSIVPTAGTITDNFFSITNLAIYKSVESSGNAITVAGGAAPVRVLLDSVWTQNYNAGSAGLHVDNTGTGSVVNGRFCQFSPANTGKAIEVVNGIVNMNNCDSSQGGAACVAMFNVQSAGVLTFTNCQLEGTAQQMINCVGGTYAVNNLYLTQTLLTNKLATGHGITLSAGAVAIMANGGFNVLTGAGAKAINGVQSANLATPPFSLVFFSNVSFANAPGTTLVRNTTVTTNKAAYSFMS